MKPLTLIGSEHSYYTGKARAYLKWSGLPFKEQVSTLDVYKQIIVPMVGWPVVPVLADDNECAVYIQDTSDIIDYCEHTYASMIVSPVLPPPACVKQRLACFCLELMGDEWLKLAAMHFRWSFPDNLDYLVFEWGRMSVPDTAPEHLEALNQKMARNMKQMSGSLPGLGVSAETIPGIESTYLEFLRLFDEHLKHHAFVLGGRPSLADFALMGPLYAHLYRDPVPGAMMKRQAPRVAEWVDRCNRRTCNVSGSDRDRGAFVSGDAIPETLWPILMLWHREHAPVLVSTARLVAKATVDKPDPVELPRFVGFHDFEVGGAKGKRAAFTFDVWMLQRLLDEAARHPSDEVGKFFNKLAGADTGAEVASPLLSLDASACRVHRRRGKKSKHGNNLFSGSGEGNEPQWVGGAARIGAVSSKL